MNQFNGIPIYATDIETTGLLDDMYEQENPKLHNLGIKRTSDGKEHCFHDGQGLKDWLIKDKKIFVMHNGITFDEPALTYLGYDVSNVETIDTLALSWYLFPKKMRHGLADWGEEFGVPKPPIDDWENLSQEEYDHRVMQDCRIQDKLWQKFYKMLKAIYVTDDEVLRICRFLTFKMKIQKVQQDTRWKLDVEAAKELRDVLAQELETKTTALAGVMPKVPVYQLKSRPSKPFKKDGTLSALGDKWRRLCISAEVPFEYEGEIKVLKERKDGNPASHVQIKEWLNNLGWKPQTFKFQRNKETGDTKQIPQTSIGDGLLCPSIEELFDKEPNLGHMKGLGVVKHRLSVVKGLLKSERNGYVQARCNGFTNTLRLKHAGLVNLPSTRVPWGKEIRGLLIQPDGYESLGADLSSLEDRVKHHFQMPYDPDYVKTQMSDDFDPHLLICEVAGLLTHAQVLAHKLGQEDHSTVRHAGKGTNYSCQYGAGAATVARAAGVSEQKGQVLKDAYWELNWSIHAIADACKVKEIGGQRWLYNPISKFWYSLRSDKDRFSTLCQGTGAYIFDMWIQEVFDICLKRFGKYPALNGQFHDEIILRTKKGDKMRKGWAKLIQESMDNLNEHLGMNRDMATDCQFGDSYAAIH